MHNIEYERCMISFVDILGFKALVETEKASRIADILRSKSLITPRDHILGDKAAIVTTDFNFSDLIVSVTPLPKGLGSPEERYAVKNGLIQIGHWQFLLSLEGIFFRGGITIGDIFCRENQLFGPGLIRAHEIESKHARWPIICIDQPLLDLQQNTQHEFVENYKSEKIVWQSMFQMERDLQARMWDSPPFLDYLYCMHYEDSTTGDMEYHLKEHKASIIHANKRFPSEKYEFLVRYHNDYCTRRFSDCSDLLIALS